MAFPVAAGTRLSMSYWYLVAYTAPGGRLPLIGTPHEQLRRRAHGLDAIHTRPYNLTIVMTRDSGA